jgi:hypothetical protein
MMPSAIEIKRPHCRSPNITRSLPVENQCHQVLKAFKSGRYQVKPKQACYDCLEIDEFWTYMGKRRAKCGLCTRIIGEAGKSWRMSGGKRGSKRRKFEEMAKTVGNTL